MATSLRYPTFVIFHEVQEVFAADVANKTRAREFKAKIKTSPAKFRRSMGQNRHLHKHILKVSRLEYQNYVPLTGATVKRTGCFDCSKRLNSSQGRGTTSSNLDSFKISTHRSFSS